MIEPTIEWDSISVQSAVCSCGYTYRTKAKLIADLGILKVVTETKCPNCDGVGQVYQLRSDPETYTV